MRTPDDRRRRRTGPVVIAAMVLLVAVGCGDDDDPPERLNGGQGTVTLVVGRTPDVDRQPVPDRVDSTR